MIDSKNEQKKTLEAHRWLIIALSSVGMIVFVSNGFGAGANEIVFAVLATITTGAIVVFAARIVRNANSRYDLVVACMFAAFASLWFAGEIVWNYEGIVLGVDQFPSMADWLWLAGYPVLFGFLLAIMLPIRKNISAKIFFASVMLSTAYFIPAAITTINVDYTTTDLLVAIGYPIANVLVLVPLICAFVLFYGTKQNYLWTIMVAIIIAVATDTGYLFLEIDGTNYPGHPIWLGYIWSYTLLAYGTYKQSIVMKNMSGSVIEQLKKEINSHASHSTRVFALAPLIIMTATIVFAFSLIRIYDFEYLSTFEIMIFQPIIYGSILSIATITGVIFLIGAKMTSIKSKIAELSRTEGDTSKAGQDSETSHQVTLLEKKLTRIENTGKKSTYVIVMLGILTAAVVGYYVYVNNAERQNTEDIPTAKFIVENIRGDTIDTWVTWNLSKDEPLHISIINADLVSEDKIDAIKSAILSEETLKIPNSEIGKVPEDVTGTYHLGWKGALVSASESLPTANIPTDIRVEATDRPIGEIVIILSNLRESDGTLGFTRSIADDQQNQILKSTITIFDVKNLNDKELSAITRHEFGHALGLGHATASEDLMYHKFNSKYAYISECDVDSIISLYGEKRSPAVVCEN